MWRFALHQAYVPLVYDGILSQIGVEGYEKLLSRNLVESAVRGGRH